MNQRTYLQAEFRARIEAFLSRERSLVKVLQDLERLGFPTRFAGGCVRDLYLNREIKDIDVATAASPDQLMDFAKVNHLSAIPTGLSHGTITLLIENASVEFTTLRRDVKTDGRKADVSFQNVGFEEDAARRDFTMNALYLDCKGEVFDYTGGLEDLREGVLRFVGDPLLRIREDYLRILRFFRFLPGLDAEQFVFKLLSKEAGSLTRVSPERIRDELIKIFSKDPATVEKMLDLQILRSILPPLPAHQRVSQWAALSSLGGGTLALLWFYFILYESVLNFESQKRAKAFIHDKFRLSQKEIEILVGLTRIHRILRKESSLPNLPSDFMALSDTLEKRFFEFSPQGILAVLPEIQSYFIALLPVTDAQFVQTFFLKWIEVESHPESRRGKSLPIQPRDLIERLSLLPGPKIGVLMKELLISFRNSMWTTREEGLEWARQHLISNP